MPRSVVGQGSITTKPKNGHRTSGSDIIANFGRSTHLKSYLSRSAIPGIFSVKDEMPNLWRSVDSNTVKIMKRAVIVCTF